MIFFVLFVSFVVRTMGWEKMQTIKVCFTEKNHFYIISFLERILRVWRLNGYFPFRSPCIVS